LVEAELLQAELTIFGFIENVSAKNHCGLPNFGVLRLAHGNQVKEKFLVRTNGLKYKKKMKQFTPSPR
jgi:hypothetical protein